MTDYQLQSSIKVDSINLWSHVGVLDNERLLGQPFLLDFIIWIDVESAAVDDDLSKTADYSLAVKRIQKLSLEINCLTIEHYSELILDELEALYGVVPMQILLTKCNPPIDGFNGSVSIKRSRNMLLT